MKFTVPKNLGEGSFFNYKRVPRKYKKKHKTLLNQYSFLTLNQKIWYVLGETNKEYRDFLIQTICNENRGL